MSNNSEHYAFVTLTLTLTLTLLPNVTLFQYWIKISNNYCPMQEMIVDSYPSASQTAYLEEDRCNSS